MRIEGVDYLIIRNREHLAEIIDSYLPDFNIPFCELIEKNRQDNIFFNDKGIYRVEYEVENPCKHGFYITKIEENDLKRVIFECEMLLEGLNEG